MDKLLSAQRGCLLGMAVGDAMGAGVDSRTLETIRLTYGPDGLLGYDLANGFAEVSSYSQLAAYAINGMLIALAKGHQTGPFLPYVTVAFKEWARSQYFPKETEKRSCWLCHEPHMRRRRSMDAWTLDALTRNVIGSPERPANRAAGAGTLLAAVAAGLLFDPQRMEPGDVGKLGAEMVALTHGDPMAFLSGAVLAYAVAGILQDPESDLESQFRNAAQAVTVQFARFPEAATLEKKLLAAISLSKTERPPVEVLEELECLDAADVLAGGMYAALVTQEDFDRAMVVAINHSGKSAAVGAVAGALLGAHLGEEALPGFYLDCLDAGPVLRELVNDLAACAPGKGQRIAFDDDWDQKYTHGLPVAREGWSVAD